MLRRSMTLPGPIGRLLIEPATSLAEHQTNPSNRHVRFLTLKAQRALKSGMSLNPRAGYPVGAP
jgi:hypothetical protein